jgi:transcriptional regulator of acetoin/glycerol metabolism
MNAHAHHVMAALDGRREATSPKIADLLRASWVRSVTEHGLEPDSIVDPDVLTRAELLEHRAPVEELSALASPEIDRLYQRLFDHAEVVMLSDAQGVVVHFRSAAAAVDRCSKLRVLPGSIWTEDRQGTTGVGLCLREQKPLSVVMGEHFATKLAALSCTVAPIFGRATGGCPERHLDEKHQPRIAGGRSRNGGQFGAPDRERLFRPSPRQSPCASTVAA